MDREHLELKVLKVRKNLLSALFSQSNLTGNAEKKGFTFSFCYR